MSCHELNKASKWSKLDRLMRATIQMHLSKSVYFTIYSCMTTHKLCQMMSDTQEKKVISTKIYLIQQLCDLWMKEFDSKPAHLNAYKDIVSQLLAQEMKIDEELCALLLMRTLPTLWETFATMMYNSSKTNLTYVGAMNSILSDDMEHKTFAQNSIDDDMEQ